ncbi:Low affinity immunoglobulin epsilon Fc receptor [Mactra antiquata]
MLLGVLALFCLVAKSLCCPQEWVANGTQCYHFSREKESWAGALVFCEHYDSYLVEIHSAMENAFLIEEAKKINANTNGTRSYWIGLNDAEVQNQFEWFHSKLTLQATGFSDWNFGEPNNHADGEDCVDLYGAKGYKWHDYHCSYNVYYICEKSEKNGPPVG